MKEALISVAEALSRVLAAADEPLSEEWVALEEAFGRTLSRDLVAARTQPPFANSAMDGYALRAADVKEPPASLKLIGESAAGRAFAGAVGAGEAVRIFTGAPIPEGADTIVIQEDVRREGERIVIAVSAKPGDNIRVAGLDFAAGETLLSAGTRLGPRAVALAAAANHRSLPVRRRPRVAILATGDELVAPGEPLGPSQIVASNNFFIAGLVEANGGIPVDLGIAIDQPSALAAKILAARDAEADVLVTLGGASVGDYDLVQKALVDAGMQLGFWRIAMRPGKPLMHGRLGAMRVLGLPGNPTSSAVCGVLFLRPLLRALLGDASAGADPSEPARLAAPLPANGIRQDYMRATLTRDDDGRWLAAPLPDQDSSLVKTLAQGGGADRAAARGAGGAGRRGLPGDQVGADGGVAPRPLVARHGQQSIRRPPIRRPRGYIRTVATSVSASASSSARASAISGNSGVGYEAFERGREDVVGFDEAGGGLVELRQRQRGQQAEAARALLARDGDGGEVGLLGGRGVVGMELTQDVAADAVQQGVGPAFSRLDRERERCVDPARGAFRVLSFGFELGEQTLDERDPQLVSLLGMCSERLSKLRLAHRTLAEPSVRPTGREFSQS